MGWGRGAGQGGPKLPVNNINVIGFNVRGRGGHNCHLIKIFLRTIRRGCDRNSAAVVGKAALLKCRLQRRRHYSFEMEETTDVTLLGRVGCIMHGVQAFERERPPRNPKHLLQYYRVPSLAAKCRALERERDAEFGTQRRGATDGWELQIWTWGSDQIGTVLWY